MIVGDSGDNTNHAKHLDSVLDGEDRTLLEMQCSRVLCSYALQGSQPEHATCLCDRIALRRALLTDQRVRIKNRNEGEGRPANKFVRTDNSLLLRNNLLRVADMIDQLETAHLAIFHHLQAFEHALQSSTT